MQNNVIVTPKKDGFTFLEVLVVLVIIGIITSGIILGFSSSTDDIRQKVNEANIKRIEGAIQLYKIDVGVFPQSINDLLFCPEGRNNWQGPYLKEIPDYPFDSSHEYVIDSLGRVKVN